MLALLAENLWTAPASHFFPYGFLLVAGALACMVALEMQRAAKESATKVDSGEFMARNPEENGMMVFFDTSEDPSDLAASRVLAQKRRAGI